VDAVLKSMSAEQFYGWMEYAALEPFGEERADLRIAILDSLVANALGGKGKRFTPRDFMPFAEDQQPTTEALHSKFQVFAAMHNARIAKQVAHG